MLWTPENGEVKIFYEEDNKKGGKKGKLTTRLVNDKNDYSQTETDNDGGTLADTCLESDRSNDDGNEIRENNQQTANEDDGSGKMDIEVRPDFCILG